MDYKNRQNKLNWLMIFPEGYCISKNCIKQFSPGSFSNLGGVQPVLFNYSKDPLTNLDMSNARTMGADFLLWFARSYTVTNVEFMKPMSYTGESVPIN